jgi:hypothetical protein
MLHVLFDQFREMLKELIHLFAFMLHGLFCNIGCFLICLFKFMIRQAADLLCFFFGDVPGMGKNRCEYAVLLPF